MGFIGGAVGYQAMKLIRPTGKTDHPGGNMYKHSSKLETLLGKSFWGEIKAAALRDETRVADAPRTVPLWRASIF